MREAGPERWTEVMTQHTGSPVRPARLIGTLVVVMALVIAAVVAARSMLGNRYEETRTYADVSDIPPHNGLFVLPTWAPTDARDIHIHVQTQGKGRSLSFATSTADLPAGCRATSRPKGRPVPDIGMQEAATQPSGYRCGEWFFVRDGDTVLGWTAYRTT
jgi:hypothetical protein